MSRHHGHSAARRIITSMKNFNDIIGNRTRDLPACSPVPQLALCETVHTKNDKRFTMNIRLQAASYSWQDRAGVDFRWGLMKRLCEGSLFVSQEQDQKGEVYRSSWPLQKIIKESTVRLHLMRGLRSWRPRIIQTNFPHMSKRIVGGMCPHGA